MFFRTLAVLAVLFLPTVFPANADAKSIHDFEAMPVVDQSAYIASFVDKMTSDVQAQNAALASQMHSFFYTQQSGKPMSEGLEKIGIELAALDRMAQEGRADLTKVQIEQVIVLVTKERFQPSSSR
jgi:hypothetical protein